MRVITHEELTGYFDLSQELVLYVNSSTYKSVYPCLVCYALVLGRHLNHHVEWHLDIKKVDKDKDTNQIQREAKRELADIRRVQIQMERDSYSLKDKYGE